MISYSDLTAADRLYCALYAKHALSTVMGVQQTFLLAQELIVNRVEGVFVECGVAAGAMVGAMARACLKHGGTRKIHLFDSFNGIPMAGPHDTSQPGLESFLVDRNLPLSERLQSSGVSEVPLDTVISILRTWDIPLGQLVFHQGWFQDTMPATPMPPIAFLRLDGDLYESTECALHHLYQSVVQGGFILLDDYPLEGSRKAFEDYFKSRGGPLPEVVVNVDTGAAWWTKL